MEKLLHVFLPGVTRILCLAQGEAMMCEQVVSMPATKIKQSTSSVWSVTRLSSAERDHDIHRSADMEVDVHADPWFLVAYVHVDCL
ncbi:hypothetical protein BR93DRAFT_923173 [Coniochaeta sp. PMI_546]|nr:hypothetical protein BR93DRAFT_923173 [Coniochaeta sp. PMI_546]